MEKLSFLIMDFEGSYEVLLDHKYFLMETVLTMKQQPFGDKLGHL